MTHFLPVLHLMTSALRRRLAPGGGVPAPDAVLSPFRRGDGPSADAPGADPGDHPALRALSPRELADLPFPRPAGQAAGDGLGGPEPQTPDADDRRHAA